MGTSTKKTKRKNPGEEKAQGKKAQGKKAQGQKVQGQKAHSQKTDGEDVSGKATSASTGNNRLDVDDTTTETVDVGEPTTRISAIDSGAVPPRTGSKSRPAKRRDDSRERSLRNLAAETQHIRHRVGSLFSGTPSPAGVAPFVGPVTRAKQQPSRRQWAKQGFIELSPGRPKLRHRILPRSVIGLSATLLAFAVGVAFSGAAFYAYYDNRLARNEQEVARFVEGFDQQFNDATGAIDDLRTETISDIRTELQPIDGFVTDADGVINLPASVGASVWALETRDEDGQASLGSAFALVKHPQGTALVTSYSVVQASATQPGPPITLIKGDQRLGAQLWSWDIDRDLAVLMVTEDLPVLPSASPGEQTQSVGTRVFAISGFGGQGATASPGVLLDESTAGLQHTAPVGSMFRGGPVVNGAGKVLGVGTLDYQPTGVDPGMVLTSPDPSLFCQQILRCTETEEKIVVEVAEGDGQTPPPGAEPVEDGAVDGQVPAPGEGATEATTE